MAGDTNAGTFLINFKKKQGVSVKISIKFHFHWQSLFNCSSTNSNVALQCRPSRMMKCGDGNNKSHHSVHLIDKCETFDFYTPIDIQNEADTDTRKKI